MEPVSAIADAVTATMSMITKALPNDELQRERFKLRFPLLYQWVKTKQLRRAAREIERNHYHVEDFVKEIGQDSIFAVLLKQRLDDKK